MKSSRPTKQQTTIIIPQTWSLIRTCSLRPPRACTAFPGNPLHFAIVGAVLSSSRLICSILRALSPDKGLDRNILTYHLLDCFIASDHSKSPQLQGSLRTERQAFAYHHSHDPRAALCIFDSSVTQRSQLLAATRSSHTATLQNATFPNADITAASRTLWNDLDESAPLFSHILKKTALSFIHQLAAIMSTDGLPYVPLVEYNNTNANGGDSLTDDMNVYYQAGDIAWMLTSTALVLLMIPGVG